MNDDAEKVQLRLLWSVAKGSNVDMPENELPRYDINRPECAQLPRGSKVGGSGPAHVRMVLDYPLTDAVPIEVREVVFEASSAGDIARKLREMYLHIYEEDAKMGGLTAKQTQEADPTWRLMNRKSGPWIWGHDLEDLWLEGLIFEWRDSAHCQVYPMIGS